MKFTAFCRELSGQGTIWIDVIEAETADEATEKALVACAHDWTVDPDDVACIGLAHGEVELVYWDDD